ncbi:exported hypothetical protein [Cupriavidus taiwanensis]|nr:exported hypothetical protein [Cupriavidus taiwanensis]SOZ52273.1 exported hypothetical protein [Cupriavidus taiwanensis]SPA04390.1 exported hypothetical protein [Cupriavidus taiwanensis]
MARKTNSAILSGAGGQAPYVLGGEHEPQTKNARWRGRFIKLAEWTGLAYVPQAAAAPAGAALLVPPRAAQAARSPPYKRKSPLARAFQNWRSGRDSNPRPPA